jgi:hypothetical protein
MIQFPGKLHRKCNDLFSTLDRGDRYLNCVVYNVQCCHDDNCCPTIHLSSSFAIHVHSLGSKLVILTSKQL